MIKIILSTLVGVLLLVIALVVFYWRDIKYDPSGQDFLIYFGLIPVAVTLFILTPMFIKKIYEYRQKKKDQQVAEAEQRSEEQAQGEKQVEEKIEWTELKVFAVSSLSALAENEAHFDLLQEAVSPELDPQLLNAFGLPILSFRIKDIEDSQEDEDLDLSNRQKRITTLIRQQLEQNSETLYQIASHLKSSAMFYDTKLAQEYRMHPAWIDPNSEYDEAVEQTAESVSRLNCLGIHIILPENLLHAWDEDYGSDTISQYLTELGIIAQQFNVEYHYWGETTAYKDWIKLLKRIQTFDSEVALLIAVDSEIDQETIDDRTWMTEKYIPSEYVSSCCVSGSQVDVQNLSAIKYMRIILNANRAVKVLKDLKLSGVEQYEQEQPFVLVLDDPTEIKSLKKLKHNFDGTAIEAHHYLYSKNSLGHTQPLAQVFGFMLSLHIKDDLFGYVYTADHQQTQVVIGTEFA